MSGSPEPGETVLGRGLAVVLLLCAAIAGMVGFWALNDSAQRGFSGTIQSAFGGLVCLGVAVVATIMAVRLWRSPRLSGPESTLAPEHAWAPEDFETDILESDEWPPAYSGLAWWSGVARQYLDKPEQAVAPLEDLCRNHPRSVRFGAALINCYSALRRSQDVEREMNRLLAVGLREGSIACLTSQWVATVFEHETPEVAESQFWSVTGGRSPKVRALLLDHLACGAFMKPKEGRRLDLADRTSAAALALNPGSTTIQGTRGSVLVELGRIAEGETLLLEVHRRSDDPINQAYSALFLAVVAQRRGEGKRARALAAKARRFALNPWIDQRLADEGL